MSWCCEVNITPYCTFTGSPPEYTKILSSYSASLEVDVEGREVQETSLTFKTQPPDQHWSIWVRYYGEGGYGARVKISHTPNNALGEQVWLQVECDVYPPDSSIATQYNDTPSSKPPPRFYLLEVGNTPHFFSLQYLNQ